MFNKNKTLKSEIPDLSEFIDDEGKKWVQTSTDDLFSINELNEILESLEKEKTDDDIILARIDFQKVNKDYYNAAIKLQKEITQKNTLLKKVISESKNSIQQKNVKLKELINYIKKLHLFIAAINKQDGDLSTISIPNLMASKPVEDGLHEYQDVEELKLHLNGVEGEKVTIS